MADNVLNKGTFLDFGFTTWGGEKKVGKDVKVETNQGEKVSDGTVNVTKKLLLCELATKIQKGDNALRNRIAKLGYAYRPGLVFLPLGVVKTALADVAEWKEIRGGYADQMAANLPKLKADDKVRLGPMYKESDYPSPEDLRAAFQVRASCKSMGDPTNIAEVDAQLLSDQAAANAAEWADLSAEWKQALRDGFLRLIGGLKDALGYKPDGKPRRFEKSTVENLQAWLGLFDAKNISDDAELAELVAKARKLVDGADPESLREDLPVRDALARSLAGVTEAAQSLATVEAPRRRFMLKGKADKADDKAA